MTGLTGIRIAYLAPRYAPDVGGVESLVRQLAERAASAGARVEVLTHRTARARLTSERIGGVTVRRFAPLGRASVYPVAPGLWHRLAASGDYDLLHAVSYHSLSSLAPAVCSSAPLVFSPCYHGTGHSPFARALHVPYRPLGRRIFGRAGAVICQSPAEAALVGSHFPEVASRLRIVPSGVDVDGLTAAQPFAESPNLVLTASRLEGYKRVDRVVDALWHLGQAPLVVLGDGPARPELTDQAAMLGLGARIRFLGRVRDEEARRWMRTAAVYVSMSEQESYGLSVAEALAAGAAVVASDIPAHRQFAAAYGQAVTLVPAQAPPRELARAIREAAARRPAPEISRLIPSWQDTADLLFSIYRELLDEVGERRSQVGLAA